MQQKLRLFISISLIMSGSIKAAVNATLPFFSTRSQGSNIAREMIGWQEHINKNTKMRHGAISMVPHYGQSIRPKDINNFYFGDDLKNDDTIKISGSRVSRARQANEWLADYFLLPTDFESEVTFKPKIKNFMVDMSFFISMNHVWEGMYFKVYSPLCHTKWNLHLKEKVLARGSNRFDAGVMNSTTDNIARTELPQTFENAMKGEIKIGDIKTPMQYGKIDGARTKTRFADIHFLFGKNFSIREKHNIGINFQFVAPTGNTPDAKWLFEPVVGNGNHWEIGGGINTSARLWTSKDEEKHFDIYLDANITHLMGCVQKRSYDFVDKPNSRYMLLTELGQPVDQLFVVPANGNTAGAVAPNYQYKKNILPAINLTTLDTKVNISVQGDAAIKFAFSYGSLTCDLGYNIWGRSKEKLTPQETIQSNRYGIKGDAIVTAIGNPGATTVAVRNVLVPLSSTQSLATINSGTNTPSGTQFFINAASDLDHRRNRGVDHPNLNPTAPNDGLAPFAYAAVPGGTPAANDDVLAYPSATGIRLASSYQPILISQTDLDTEDRPSALSHKIFGHINYTWKETVEESWKTFCGLGFEAEFASKQNNLHTTLSQWGIWAKGGIAFN